jgi:phosphoribosylglycinamide formyltransferase-1
MVLAFPDRIANIHPRCFRSTAAGMFGEHVHKAVLAAGEKESGITIHLVNERYDEGQVLFQAACPVLPEDDADALAARIHAMEHAHYPAVVEGIVNSIRDKTVE